MGTGGYVFSGLGGFSNALGSANSSMIAASGGAYSVANLTLNASKGEKKMNGTIKNTVYGKSDNVTPTNFTKKVWRRIS